MQETSADRFFAMMGFSRILSEAPAPLSLAEPSEPVADYSMMSISDLAQEVRRDWRNVYFGAKPYLSAMFSLHDINDNFGYDSGREVVNYFLGNARGWKGPVAKGIKAELKRRISGR